MPINYQKTHEIIALFNYSSAFVIAYVK